MVKVNCILFLWAAIPMRIMAHNLALKSDNLSLAEVTLILLREHLSNLTSTVVIAERSSLPELASTNVMLVDYILQHLDGRIAVQLYMHDYSAQPWEYYVFTIDSLQAFKEVYHGFQYNLYERHFRFLIVLTKRTPDFRKIMEEIFELCYHYDVFDVNIITDHSEKGVSMYTYFLYSENVCRGCLPTRLYSFNDGFENLKNVFPEKLNNFHRCPFKVTSRNLPPFLSFDGNTSDPKPVGIWENLSGIEGELLKLLAQKLNFTIDLRPFPVERSYVQDNRTYGCFTELKDGRVDIAVGCFGGSNPSRRFFSPTNPFHNAPYLYVVRGKRNPNALSRLGQPFTNQVWIYVGVFLILTIVFIWLIKLKVRQFVFGKENHNPVTNFLALFLGYPIGRTPRRNFARYIFFQLLFFTLILRNAYQGSLYDAFRMDRFVWNPSGYDDLIKWNYTIILPPETAQLSLFPKHLTINQDSDGYEPRLQVLERLEGKYVTVVIQDGYLHYLQKTLRNGSELFLIPEAIYNYQFVMFLPKHSIYLNILNRKFKQFAGAGIMAKLSSNFTLNLSTLRKLMEKPKQIPLSNERLEALYVIHVLLLIISLVVFSLELLSVQCKRLRRGFIRII